MQKPNWQETRSWCKHNWILLALFGSSIFTIWLTGWLAYYDLRPPVGAYIAIMGLIGAAMAARKEPSGREKALWMVLITILMVAEIRNLYVEDREQVRKFGIVETGLKATATGLEAAATKIQGIS